MVEMAAPVRRERSDEMLVVIDAVERRLIKERIDAWISERTAAGVPPSQAEVRAVRKRYEGRGGIAWLARALDLKKQAISRWYRVPIERVAQVSRLTGIPRHKIRPDKPDLFPPPETGRKLKVGVD